MNLLAKLLRVDSHILQGLLLLSLVLLESLELLLQVRDDTGVVIFLEVCLLLSITLRLGKETILLCDQAIVFRVNLVELFCQGVFLVLEISDFLIECLDLFHQLVYLSSQLGYL